MTPFRHALALGIALAACASDPPARAPRLDPSNPDAPESTPPAPSAQASSSEPAEAAHEHRAPNATVYTCPMHPEIQQPTPGRCPKCGMTLVPKTDAGSE